MLQVALFLHTPRRPLIDSASIVYHIVKLVLMLTLVLVVKLDIYLIPALIYVIVLQDKYC